MALRVRLRVVGLSVLLVLVVVFGGLGALAAYAAWRTPARSYTQDFDANLAATQPKLAPAIKADPVLYNVLRDRTTAAFLQGGWPQASTVFFHIVHARMSAFAGDKAALACHAAWQNAYRALLPTPHACKLLYTEGSDAVPRGLAKAEIDRASSLCDDMAVQGAELRSLPDPPSQGSWNEHTKLWSTDLAAPRPMPDGERAALTHPASADDATFCRAIVDHGDNLSAQPLHVAGREIRYEYSTEDEDGFGLRPAVAPVARTDPPAELTCAPAGKRFTLSMYAGDGKPITWQSLGQRKWDCAIQSSASGLRGLWASLDDGDGSNALRLLWPLSVGKTVICDCEGDNTATLRVASYETYWLPWGRFRAYAVEEDVSAWNGVKLYATTKYWAPELGFVIGQKTTVFHGDWPDSNAPDWQLVAME